MVITNRLSVARRDPLQILPCAARGLISYRYPSNYGGWIMIGATSHDDAIREANRSLAHPRATLDLLEVWDGLSRYVLAVTP